MNEIRIRIPISLHKSLTFAAAKRGMATAALVSLAAYEYLRERGELTDNDVAVVKPDPGTLGVWLEGDD